MTVVSNPTWRELRNDVIAQLGDAAEARWIIEHASGYDQAELLVAIDQPAPTAAASHVQSMLDRRLAGEPLQYVLGTWQFRKLDLYIDRRVLIPRPETELVTQYAIDFARDHAARQLHSVRVLDLGTGSGAIAISIAKEVPESEVHATDNSLGALAVASANIAAAGSNVARRVVLHDGDWYDALPEHMAGTFDVIVSNPPYLTAIDMTELDESVRDWEPHSALTTAADGMAAFEIILRDATTWLKPGAWIVLEHGASQGEPLTQLARDSGLVAVEDFLDLAGHARCTVGRRPEA